LQTANKEVLCVSAVGHCAVEGSRSSTSRSTPSPRQKLGRWTLANLPKSLDGSTVWEGDGEVTFDLADFSFGLFSRRVGDDYVSGRELGTPFTLGVVGINLESSEELVLEYRRYNRDVVTLGFASVLACTATS